MEKTTVLVDEYSTIKDDLLRLPNDMLNYKIFHIIGIDKIYIKNYIYENDEKICSISCRFKINFNKNKFYGKRISSTGMTYNKKTKKITMWDKDKPQLNSLIIKNFLSYLKIDWPYKIREYDNYCSLPLNVMLTKTLLEHIVNGKVTNPRSLIKDYIKISLKAKNLPWKLVRDFYNKQDEIFGNRYYYHLTLNNILNYSTNPISALNRLLTFNFSQNHLQLIDKNINYCKILTEKVNFNWSEKRLTNIIQKQKRQLDKLELALTNPLPIKYEGNLPLLDNMSLIDNQTLVYELGFKSMWDGILKKHFFLLSYNCNGEDLFIRVSCSRKEEELSYIIFNSKEEETKLPNEDKEKINLWLNDFMVRSFFLSQVCINNLSSRMPF